MNERPLGKRRARVDGSVQIHNLRERLLGPVLLLVSLLLLGTAGYFFIGYFSGVENISLKTCFYQTGVLLTGVGFGDELGSYKTWTGVLFTVFMSFLGLGALLYNLTALTAFVVEGELSEFLEQKKMQKRIAELSGHYVLCGAGETGRHIVSELLVTGVPFILIEQDAERVEKLESLGSFPYLVADGSDDDTLLAAGIERARGFITTLPNDKDNLLMVITARQLNPNLRIVTRCADITNEGKLRKVGADAVVVPNAIGGLRMASELIRPTAVSFLDTMLRGSRAIRFEDLSIPAGHSFVGKTLAEANMPAIADVNIIATRYSDAEDFIYNPRGNLALKANMELVAVGSPTEVSKLRQKLLPATPAS